MSSIFNQLISLNDHCERLSLILQYNFISEKSANWLRVAYGVKSIDYDGMLRDSSFTMCRPSYEYESSKRKVHNDIVNEMVRFNIIWSGLEYLLTDLTLEKCPHKKGKVNSASYFLSNNSLLELDEYDMFLEELLRIIPLIEDKRLAQKIKNLPEWLSVEGKGLFIVYKIRNMFAHGDFLFPESKEYDEMGEVNHEDKLINVASRIVLLSIQMLLFSHNSIDKEYIMDNNPFLKFCDEKTGLYLKKLHLSSYEGNGESTW